MAWSRTIATAEAVSTIARNSHARVWADRDGARTSPRSAKGRSDGVTTDWNASEHPDRRDAVGLERRSGREGAESARSRAKGCDRGASPKTRAIPGLVPTPPLIAM